MHHTTTYDFVSGEVLLIDKAYGWTSFDVVNKVRLLIRDYAGIKKLKVGHAGTLDPLATGLMVVCTGKKTKEIQYMQAADKEYVADIFFGAQTPSYDLETLPEQFHDIAFLNEDMLQQSLLQFTGAQLQTPPMYSAKNINGKRAYELARKGHENVLPPNDIIIHDLRLISYKAPVMQCFVRSSKGTYIRSLAHDLGQKIGCGAYLHNLRRVASGNYKIEDAISIEAFENLLKIYNTNALH